MLECVWRYGETEERWRKVYIAGEKNRRKGRDTGGKKGDKKKISHPTQTAPPNGEKAQVSIPSPLAVEPSLVADWLSLVRSQKRSFLIGGEGN